MDRLIYTAMSGAKMLTQRQDSIANNLANATTTGFRAETTTFRAVPVNGPGEPTRVASIETTTGADFRPGPISQTGNPLDVAINGQGFFAVQATDGTEAYTRDGQFQLSAEGALQTRSGLAVVGEGGPITIPPDHNVLIARDGSISAIPTTGRPNVVAVGRLKLVKPDESQLQRSGDGLFRLKGGGEADPDPAVPVAAGAIEASNVNAVEALVGMIAVARQFETQMRLLQSADQNAREATRLFSTSS